MSQGKGIGGHTAPPGTAASQDWITPRYIIDKLGPFDLDPCESLTQPWPCAKRGYTVRENGLKQPWRKDEFVYVNPPYDNSEPFMEILADQRNGLGLLFGRTETKAFTKLWESADAMLFIKGRLWFYRPDGTRAKSNSGGPSVVLAYGKLAIERLQASGLPGALVTNWALQNLDAVIPSTS